MEMAKEKATENTNKPYKTTKAAHIVRPLLF